MTKRTKEPLCGCGHLKKDHEDDGEGVCAICRRDHTVGLIGCPSYNAGRKKVDPFEYELAERKRDAIQAIEALFECAKRVRTDIDPNAMLAPIVKAKPNGAIEHEVDPEGRRETPGTLHTMTRESVLGKGEESVLVLIASSERGATTAQIAVKLRYARRTVDNITSELKKIGLVEKSDLDRWIATEDGKDHTRGKVPNLEKGAILGDLSPLEREVLLAIAQSQNGATDAMLAAMVQRATARSRQNALSALRNTYELIERSGDRHVLCEHAREELAEHIEKPVTGKALRERCKASLPEPERAVFEYLERSASRTAPIDHIAEGLDYAPRSVENIVARLKAREIVVRTNIGVKLLDVFFE